MTAPRTRSAGWFKCSEDGWEEAVAFFPPGWSATRARTDLAWWARRVERGEAERIPSRRTLAERWGWSERQVRALLADDPIPAQKRSSSDPAQDGPTSAIGQKRPKSDPAPIQGAAQPSPVVAVVPPISTPLREKREEKEILPTTKDRVSGEEQGADEERPVVGRLDLVSPKEVRPETRLAQVRGMAGYIVTSLETLGIETFADLAGWSRGALAEAWRYARVERLDRLEQGLWTAGLTWTPSGYTPQARAETARPEGCPLSAAEAFEQCVKAIGPEGPEGKKHLTPCAFNGWYLWPTPQDTPDRRIHRALLAALVVATERKDASYAWEAWHRHHPQFDRPRLRRAFLAAWAGCWQRSDERVTA